jgi:hypothetical protein
LNVRALDVCNRARYREIVKISRGQVVRLLLQNTQRESGGEEIAA